MKKKKIIIKATIILLGLASAGSGVFLYLCKNKNLTTKNQLVLEEKQLEPSVLKIGFLTDWEYGSHRKVEEKMTRRAPIELAKAVFYLNEEFQPDITIGGGDYVESSSTDAEGAKEQLSDINEVFSLVKSPRLYAFGNHDFRALPEEAVREALGVSEFHSFQDVGEWRIVILDTNFNKFGKHRSAENYVRGQVSQEELSWLKSSLETDRPVLLFCHHSPINVPVGGRISRNIDNAGEVREILENAGNVAAVISGHNPTSYFARLNGINYFIANTMANINARDNFATFETTYDHENGNAKITFKQLGPDAREYETEWKQGEKAPDYQYPPVISPKAPEKEQTEL